MVGRAGVKMSDEFSHVPAHPDYLVAPFEADAQLAYLAREGQVAAVISDDSDMLVFGAPEVIFKLDIAG